MAEPDTEKVLRENIFLKQRLAQVESDLADVRAEAGRLRELLERAAARKPPQA